MWLSLSFLPILLRPFIMLSDCVNCPMFYSIKQFTIKPSFVNCLLQSSNALNSLDHKNMKNWKELSWNILLIFCKSVDMFVMRHVSLYRDVIIAIVNCIKFIFDYPHPLYLNLYLVLIQFSSYFVKQLSLKYFCKYKVTKLYG